jgi:hypothetical protein
LGNSNEQNENTSHTSAGWTECVEAANTMNGKPADITTSNQSYGIDVTSAAYKQERASTMKHLFSTIIERLTSFAFVTVAIAALAVATVALLLIFTTALSPA